MAIARKLLDCQKRREYPGYHELGHCFIFLQRHADSILSFQQQVIRWNEVDDPLYCVTCNNCPELKNIVGIRYVCEICPDVDLCTECMQQYGHNGDLHFCKDHPFIEVPTPERGRVPMQTTDIVPENVQIWLRQLIREFDGAS